MLSMYRCALYIGAVSLVGWLAACFVLTDMHNYTRTRSCYRNTEYVRFESLFWLHAHMPFIWHWLTLSILHNSRSHLGTQSSWLNETKRNDSKCISMRLCVALLCLFFVWLWYDVFLLITLCVRLMIFSCFVIVFVVRLTECCVCTRSE